MTGEISKAAERLARERHGDPAGGLEEARAAERCCRLPEEWNFKVERGIAGPPTICITLKGRNDRVGWHSRELAVRTGSESAYAGMHRAADILTACGTRILEGTVPT